MSRARLLLHAVAFVAPLLAAAGFAAMVNRDPGYIGTQMAWFGGAGVIAAQAIAWLRWPALVRRAKAGRGGWITGIGMAALTHVLFGVVAAVGLHFAAGPDSSTVSQMTMQAAFFAVASLLPTGWVTFPLTAAVAEIVAQRRARELAHGAA